MKAYKIEVLVIDHGRLGPEGIADALENARYPDRCISPSVKGLVGRDIGSWHDEHPLKFLNKEDAEYQRLFYGEE